MPLYMPASSAPPTTYLFIDGGSLRGRIQNISKSVFNGRVLKIDFQKIAHLATKTFYYDAIPTRKPAEADNEFDQRLNAAKALLDAAASVDGIHVYEGETRYRRKRGNEQKKVDVMLAVDLMSHTFRRNMSRATLLTGDLDFKPLIDAVVQEGMFITLWYPPGETNEELIRSADGRQRLDLRSIHTILCDECQASISLPSTRIENYCREGGIFLGEIDGAYGLIKIRKELKEFIVYIPIQNKKDKFIVASHSDWKLLRFFVGDCFDAVIPECPPCHGDL